MPRVAAIVGSLAVLAGCGGGGGGGDDVLAQGETGVVEYTKTTKAGTPGDPTTLAVTVTDVRRGTKEELTKGGLELDEDNSDSTPYYIDSRFENRGQNAVPRNISLMLEGSDEKSLPGTLFLNYGDKPYKPCPDKSKGTLKPGESFETCTLVLVPAGEEAETVLLTSQKANSEIVFTRWDASE